MARYRITISNHSGQAMADLVKVYQIQVLDHGSHRDKAAGLVIHAIVEESDIQRLQQAGYSVEQHEDVDATGKARQKEVGQGNRYENGRPR